MKQPETEFCPECEGRKGGMVHLRTSNGGRWQQMDCHFCGGSGVVEVAKADRWREGKRLREDRKARLVTLREEAARLGISAKELSDRESGRVPCPLVPDPAPAPHDR